MATMAAILDFQLERFYLFIYLYFFFDLQVIPMLPTKFQVNWPFCSGEEAKNRFSRCGHLVFPIGTILAIFDLQVARMLPTKFQVHLLFGSGEKAKNRFSRWYPLLPSWIRTILAIFYLQVILMLPTKFCLREEAKIDFQDGHHDVGFPIRMILAIFYLQVTPMLPVF